MACLACGRVPRSTHRTHFVLSKTRSKRFVELAFLWLAPWRGGIRRHCLVVGTDCCNAHRVLAHPANSRRTTHSVSSLGQFRFSAQLCGVAAQPTDSGVTAVRLWSLHPKYLDAKGLVALWREALLAQAVLRGQTRGYIHHPQLERFRSHPSPRLAINTYLAVVHSEACSRGYAFDRDKIGPVRPVPPISVQRGQIQHEWTHLLAKLAARSPSSFEQWSALKRPTCHPLFCLKNGGVATWERV